MAVKNARDIAVYTEDVGEPRDGMQDVVSVRLHYFKGRGYQMLGRVYRREANPKPGAFFTSMALMRFTGITTRADVESARRFNARKLAKLAEGLMDSPQLKEAVAAMKAELAKRLETGEDY